MSVEPQPERTLRIVEATGEVADEPGCPACAHKDERIEALEDALEGLKNMIATTAGKNTNLRKARHVEIGASPKAAKVKRIYTHWRKGHKTPTGKPSRAPEECPVDVGEKIATRLKDFSEEDLLEAIDGYHAFPYVADSGRVATGTADQKHDGIALIMRNTEQVMKGLDYAARAKGESEPNWSAGQTTSEPPAPKPKPAPTLFTPELPPGPLDVHGLYSEIGLALPGTSAPNVSVRCFAAPEAHRRDDRNASCSVSTETGAWRCWGCGAAGGAYDAALAMGQQPRYAMELLERYGFVARKEVAPRPTGSREKLAEDARRALAQNTRALERLQEVRGWSPAAVLSLGLGLASDRILFPVRDGQGTLVGINRYAPNPATRNGGPKLKADPGSKRELFPAPETVEGEELWIVEGEPDSVAARSIEVPAVGIPGVQGWRAEWASRFEGRRTIVCLDCDTEGREAAQRVLADLQPAAAEVRVVDLAPARDDGHDLGDLVRAAGPGPTAARGVAATLRRLAEAAR